MKQIIKGNEPTDLTNYRQQKDALYEDYAGKDELRDCLEAEQKGICCYCMSRLTVGPLTMKIEHFKCQEDNPQYQLQYWNMLGACKGNEGQPLKLQHCDTFKGQKRLSFNPATKISDIHRIIWYGNDGSINSTNTTLNTEINSVLNLNVSILKRNRKAALDGFKETLARYNGRVTKAILQRWLNEWKGTQNQEKLKPYCMVVVYYIEKRIRQL